VIDALDFQRGPWAKVHSPKSIVQSLGAGFNVQCSKSKVQGSPLLALLLAALLSSFGCQTAAPLPKVNLQEPGWSVRQGQAVWHLEHGTREIAGDLVVANGPNNRSFVQFSKSPFSLVVAQSNSNQWAVEFPPQNKHYAGRGHPPLRLIWLYLPRVLAGEPPPKGWIWRQDNTQWHLENPATGESLEGYFNS
jgi:hypothetical protein